jgi:predicted acylesterase/phospholipase RssA
VSGQAGAPAPQAPQPPYAIEEIRLAMAWNGGVSLAIWMGGVAVELDSARRARQNPSGAAESEAAELTPAEREAEAAERKAAERTRRLYKALCEAFNRTLEIDILCGASAGGLNAALLGAAIESGGELTPRFLRGHWLTMGDFESLLQPIGNSQPAALMQGELFFERLQKVFAELLGAAMTDARPTPAKVLLDVQVTDVEGRERSFIDDWEQPFFAREYRTPVRFRTAADYTAGTLAAAARASASFPGAFEAQRLNGRAAQLAGFPAQERWAIDGGVLENAPIRQAIDLIPTRRASGPVKRFVCYVNADPATHQNDREDTPEPPLAKVLSYSLTLPRTARLVDQLQALEDAKRRGGDMATGLELLGAGPALDAVADSLLPTYQRRRALLSLSELLEAPGVVSGPGLAHRVLNKLTGPGQLPWIPLDLTPPDAPCQWRWGVRAGQRVLQLQLDVLAHVVKAIGEADHQDSPQTARDEATIFAARGEISTALAKLDGVQRDFTDPCGSVAEQAQELRKVCEMRDAHDEALRDALAELGRLYGGTAKIVGDYVLAGTAALRMALDALGSQAAPEALPPREALFGACGGDADQHFIGRALAVEVIRRSLSDDVEIEPGKELHVAQFTPMAPTLLFTKEPLSEVKRKLVPSSPEEKLTGIRLGHFGAFYRSSWRANDFMWGRLDGACHAVRVLVDHERAQALCKRKETPWKTLADALVPDSDDAADGAQRRLVLEVLDSTPDADGGDAHDESPAAAGDEDALHERLEERIKADLTEAEGELTRILFTRALQFEAFDVEARRVAAQAEKDREAGAYDTSVGWGAGDQPWGLIDAMRRRLSQEEPESLADALGRDSGDEGTSTLAARTISHAGLVALAAITGVVPFTRSIQPARVPLFAVQGISARRLLDGLGVLLGFTGAAWYLAARYLTLPRPPNAQRVPLGALWSVNSLVLWVSLLAVIGIVVMPALRAIGSTQLRRKLGQGAFALGLAACGGGVALGWQWSLNGSAVALTSSGATYAPPEWLMWLVAAAGGFQVASQLNSVSNVLAPLGRLVANRVSTGALLAGLLGGTMAGFTMVNAIWPALDHWGWKTAIFALAWAAPVLFALYLRLWERPLE